MEYILAPSILSADFKNLGAELQTIKECGAKWVHIDVMDGFFVPSISFGMPVIKSIRNATDCIFDVHLMIEEPIRYINYFKESGADIITVHYEACDNVKETLEEIKREGLMTGLSIKPGTDVEILNDYVDVCDLFLLMSVEPGFGGQKYIQESTERAKKIRDIIDSSEKDIFLEIDGGVNRDNIDMILDAGVNVIVAGSAVFKDTKENTTFFMNKINERNKISD